MEPQSQMEIRYPDASHKRQLNAFLGRLSVCWRLIPPEDGNLIEEIIINRFRGNAALFDDGIG
jgi:hypothetical protein